MVPFLTAVQHQLRTSATGSTSGRSDELAGKAQLIDYEVFRKLSFTRFKLQLARVPVWLRECERTNSSRSNWGDEQSTTFGGTHSSVMVSLLHEVTGGLRRDECVIVTVFWLLGRRQRLLLGHCGNQRLRTEHELVDGALFGRAFDVIQFGLRQITSHHDILGNGGISRRSIRKSDADIDDEVLDVPLTARCDDHDGLNRAGAKSSEDQLLRIRSTIITAYRNRLIANDLVTSSIRLDLEFEPDYLLNGDLRHG